MTKRKGYTFGGNGNNVEYDEYDPESPIKEAINISNALKPLRFKIMGFCHEGRDDYVLHLRFIRGLSHDTLDDFGVAADGHEKIVANSPHDNPDSTV